MADKRETIGVNQSFYQMLQDLQQSQIETSILFEENGITRATGLITDLVSRDGNSFLKLAGFEEISLERLYAVNGVFRSDYSKC